MVECVSLMSRPSPFGPVAPVSPFAPWMQVADTEFAPPCVVAVVRCHMYLPDCHAGAVVDQPDAGGVVCDAPSAYSTFTLATVLLMVVVRPSAVCLTCDSCDAVA